MNRYDNSKPLQKNAIDECSLFTVNGTLSLHVKWQLYTKTGAAFVIFDSEII